MNLADLLVCAFLLFYFFRGFVSGFLRTLLSPIALVLGTALAYVYYQSSHDFIKALLLSILSPFVIGLLLRGLLKIYESTGGRKSAIGPVSRFAGGFLAVGWSGLWLILILIFVTLIPTEKPGLKAVQETVTLSTTYGRINAWLGDKLPGSSTLGVHKLAEVMEDPERYEELSETQEYEELMNDPSIRDVLTDKETLKQLEKRNIPELMQNPKFRALLENRELLTKMIALHEKLIQMEAEPSESTDSPEGAALLE